MNWSKRERPTGGGRRGVEDRKRNGQGSLVTNGITAAEIAHALEARRVGPGRWIAKCPAHEDRTPSFSIREGATAPLLTCFAGCDRGAVIDVLRERGLWPQQRSAAIPGGRRRTDLAELWREAAQHLAHGTRPRRRPPFSRTLPAMGEVWIFAGTGAWEAAQMNRELGRHVLVWPPGAPSLAYAWPVRRRAVRVFEAPGDDLTLDPDALKDFGRLLVARWGALSCELFPEGANPVRIAPEGGSHAA